MLLSMAVRIAYYSLGIEGAEGIGTAWFEVFFIVLPCAANLWFIYALLFHGENRLYKTISPVYLGVIFLLARIVALYNQPGTVIHSWWQAVISFILCIVICVIYSLTINAGLIKSRLPLIIGLAIPFIYHIAVEDIPHFAEHPQWQYWLGELSLLLIMLSLLLMAAGMRKIGSDSPLPRRGDRCDGRRLRTLDPISGVAVYIMVNRSGASNKFKDSFECSNAEKYIRRKREEGLTHFGYMHLIVAAYVRVISQRPAANRFISGQKIYSRGDEIEVAMTIKKEMTTDGSETIIKIYFSPDDTVYDVYRKFNEQVEAVKNSNELDSSFDSLAGMLNLIPGVFMKFTVWLLKLIDYFGGLPRALLRLSPFHGSMFITSMGSLGIPPVYHHLYDFGNIPIFIAFGIKRRQCEMKPDGSIAEHKYIDFTFVIDDRICDGFYFASALKLFKRLLSSPERLDVPPESVIRDVE